MADITLSQSPQSSSTSGEQNSTGVRYAKDYHLITINLMGNFPTLDLKDSMMELSYYEDIFNNITSGEVAITDAHGYIEKLNMSGNEYIRIAFGKDDNPDMRMDGVFRVYKVSPRRRGIGFDSEQYVIHFCSEELMLSEQYKISQSYKDKKISDIIKDILKTYLKVPDSKYDDEQIEDTKGTYSFIVPNMKPLEAINWVTMYAQAKNAKSTGADMLFYENQDGFNFASLQSLFQEDPYFNYQYRLKNTTSNQHGGDENKKIFNVINYEILNSFDSLKNINSGVYANKVLTLDPLLRKFEEHKFNYKDYLDKSVTLNGKGIVDNRQNRFGHEVYNTPDANFKLAISNKDQVKAPYIKGKTDAVSKDFGTETYLQNRKAQLAMANHTKLKLYIPGDPNIVVGMTINFDLMTQDPGTKEAPKETDKLYSGKYLITALRHIIQPNAYTTIMEVVKDSSKSGPATVNNDLPINKNTVAGKT